MKRTIWLMLLFFIVAGRTLAQGDCPAIVQTALQSAGDVCTELGRNQACYGNISLRAEAQPNAQAFTFERAGDIVDLNAVASFHLSPMDVDAQTWGVALLKTQANLPDTLPGQNVTMVLFGQVDVTNATASEAEITPEPRPIVFIATASSTINVRSGPSTTDAVFASLQAGATAPTDGRNEDSTWLHIQLDDGTTGWVSAALVSVDGDVSLLPVTDGATPEDQATPVPDYTPMQAFYFTTGIGDAPCAEAPDSGILIQTPEGVGTIDLLINEVSVRLGSTAYITACPCGDMVVRVLEGHGVVTALGSTVIIPAGTEAHVHLDDNSVPDSEPVGPEPYDDSQVAALPLTLLPQPITPAPSLTEDEIAADTLQEGDWTMTYTDLNTCTPDVTPTAETYALQLTGSEFEYPEGTPPGSSYPLAFFQNDGVTIRHEYTDDVVFGDNSSEHVVMTVISPTHIQTVITYTPTDNCVEILTYDYTANDAGD